MDSWGFVPCQNIEDNFCFFMSPLLIFFLVLFPCGFFFCNCVCSIFWENIQSEFIVAVNNNKNNRITTKNCNEKIQKDYYNFNANCEKQEYTIKNNWIAAQIQNSHQNQQVTCTPAPHAAAIPARSPMARVIAPYPIPALPDTLATPIFLWLKQSVSLLRLKIFQTQQSFTQHGRCTERRWSWPLAKDDRHKQMRSLGLAQAKQTATDLPRLRSYKTFFSCPGTVSQNLLTKLGRHANQFFTSAFSPTNFCDT